MLVDEEDRQDFDDVLAGKVVESKGTLALSLSLTCVIIIILFT